MKKLPVTVVSGFLGAGKTTLLNHLLNENHGQRIAIIVNDMSEVNIDASLVRGGPSSLRRVDEKLVEMTNGCICCTLREDLLEEVALLAKEKRFDYLLIESTGISEPIPVAQTFTFETEEGTSLLDVSRLDTMVTVVDAANFMNELADADDLQARGQAVNEDDERTVADLLIEQVEFANVIVVNKTDLVDPREATELQAMLRKLNPGARIIATSNARVAPNDVLGTGLFNYDEAAASAGWLRELSEEHVPETDTYGIESFVFRARRPFHPQRLWDFLHGEWSGVVRSKGFFWLATRHPAVYQWSQAGGACNYQPAGVWWAAVPQEDWGHDDGERPDQSPEWHPRYGDRRQELVFIGMQMNKEELLKRLDACLLSDGEAKAGSLAWEKLLDPFPPLPLEQEAANV